MSTRYTVRARADLAAIRSYLQEQNPRAAAVVMTAIHTRIGWLADFPLIAPETDEPGVRALPLVRYPYRYITKSPVKRSASCTSATHGGNRGAADHSKQGGLAQRNPPSTSRWRVTPSAKHPQGPAAGLNPRNPLLPSKGAALADLKIAMTACYGVGMIEFVILLASRAARRCRCGSVWAECDGMGKWRNSRIIPGSAKGIPDYVE